MSVSCLWLSVFVLSSDDVWSLTYRFHQPTSLADQHWKSVLVVGETLYLRDREKEGEPQTVWACDFQGNELRQMLAVDEGHLDDLFQRNDQGFVRWRVPGKGTAELPIDQPFSGEFFGQTHFVIFGNGRRLMWSRPPQAPDQMTAMMMEAQGDLQRLEANASSGFYFETTDTDRALMTQFTEEQWLPSTISGRSDLALESQQSTPSTPALAIGSNGTLAAFWFDDENQREISLVTQEGVVLPPLLLPEDGLDGVHRLFRDQIDRYRTIGEVQLYEEEGLAFVYEEKRQVLRLLSLATGKELAHAVMPSRATSFSFSPEKEALFLVLLGFKGIMVLETDFSRYYQEPGDPL